VMPRLLKFVQCMRTHSVPNFPDPITMGGGVGFKYSQAQGVDPNSALFQAAQKACKSIGDSIGF